MGICWDIMFIVSAWSIAELLCPLTDSWKTCGEISTFKQHLLLSGTVQMGLLWFYCYWVWVFTSSIRISHEKWGEQTTKLKEILIMGLPFFFYYSLAQGMKLKKSTRALPIIDTATTCCSMTARMLVQNKGTRVLSPLSRPAWTQFRLHSCFCPQQAFMCGVNVFALSPDLLCVCSPASVMFWWLQLITIGLQTLSNLLSVGEGLAVLPLKAWPNFV